MNISYNWLKEYIDFNLTPAELAAALTSIGLETGSIEEVESIPGGLRGIVIGKVITCNDHPDSDHLHVTTVDLGLPEGPVQIVCGAPNVAAGQTVVVATVGTVLRSPSDGSEFTIKKSKIRGQESKGMICAEDEIGIGSSHEGIIVINDEVKPGTPAADYFNIHNDYVLEVDLTPNRVDAASHYGVARDLAAWTGIHSTPSKAIKPSVDQFHIDTPDEFVKVVVDDSEACPRYCGLTIRGVQVKDSPDWLKERLMAIGQKPINNIVDITNYILHGLGQPLHCFDLKEIAGNTVTVKKVAEGTPFVTLDGTERKLSSSDLMICGNNGPMCIAGVFGGLNSGVTHSTTDIFLESAYFNPTAIRKTARRHGLSTDASFRYERGTDPNFCLYALKLAALMVKELAGGRICGEPVDIYPVKINPFDITLKYSGVNKLIGKDIPAETIDKILDLLEIQITGHRDDDNIELKVPTYRVDVKRPCDVTEEILRIYGFNNIECGNTIKSSLSYNTLTDQSNDLRRIIAEQLTAIGFNEIMNNSLTSVSYYENNSEYPLSDCVRILNPLSNDLGVMRQTLLFGGLESLAHNINRRSRNLMFYEFGNIYSYNSAATSNIENPLAPYKESSHIALWLTGDIRQGNWLRPTESATFFDLRAVVANIFGRLGINAKEILLQVTDSDNIFSNVTSISTRSGKQLGKMGVLLPRLLNRFDIGQPVFYAELDWKAMVKLALAKKVSFTPLPRTQPVKRDLALLIDKSVTMNQIETIVLSSEKRLLREVSLFDVYEGKNLPAGKKSYAISITLVDNEKTLTDKQIDAIMSKITENLRKQVGAELR